VLSRRPKKQTYRMEKKFRPALLSYLIQKLKEVKKVRDKYYREKKNTQYK
jgi:hypothetical protein